MIPASIDDIDDQWMSSALGGDIAIERIEQIGVGVGVASAVYRAHLDGFTVPSVVIKLPALDEAAAFTSTVLSMYRREVRFFAELAHDAPIRVPAGYFGEVSDDGGQFVQIMEDMGDLRAVDQNAGMELSDAEAAVDAVALWHAHWWGKAQPIIDRGTAVALVDPIYPAVLPGVYAEGWEKVTGAMPVADSITAIGLRWIDAMPHLLQALGAEPHTLVHGDYRADNILFGDDGSVVPLDFQLIGSASASYDLAYFVTQSLDAEVASASEQALFDRWLERLLALGVPEAETTDLWTKYRQAALHCLVYPIVAARGCDFDDPRQYDLINNMNTRFARVCDELDLADLIG